MIPGITRKGLVFAGVLLPVLGLAFLLFASRPRMELPNVLPEPAEPRVTQGPFESVLLLTGSLVALRSEQLKVPLTETFRVQIKWMAKEGASVRAGDPVVRFDTASLASMIETQEEALKAKREEITRRKAEFENQTFELDVEVKKADNDNRQKGLDASIPEGLESKYEYDRKQLDKKASDQALAGARSNRSVKTADMDRQVRTLQIEAGEVAARLKALESSLASLTLYAHSMGTMLYYVDETNGRKVQVGDTIMAMWTVATIPDPASLLVQAWISETHIQRIRIGQSVGLSLDAYPDRRYSGTVREISQSADPVRRWGRSNYFRVDIGFDALDPDIMKPGMSVKCEVRSPRRPDVLLVPQELTVFDGRSFWARPAGGAPLRLAALDYNDFHVAADPRDNPGLKAGMKLVTVGPLPGSDGARDR